MCGIAGYATTSPHPYPDSVIERMTYILAHRGPDGFGYYRQPQVSFGHRRLSIIDLATGAQPMPNEDSTRWIIYNGEIFNHSDRRPELERAGHRYRSHCDTETILHAYEEYGPECLAYFRGMFAFAIWDSNNNTLFCARDRLGIKPFYYYWDGRLFAFASEIKALFEHPAISARLEESQVAESLALGYVSEERTLFGGIRQLLPGHHLTLRLSAPEPAPRVDRYWDIPAPEAAAESDDYWISECRRRLEETVRMRLMSDVPLGMFLSGGVDSSVIAALMKGMVAGPIDTFSVGYAEDRYSELGYARQVADHLGSRHHEVRVGVEDFFGALPRLIWHEDEPITWPSSVALYFVSRLAAGHVKVVLTGEGSDEMFAGYSRYSHYLRNRRVLSYYRIAPNGLRRLLRAKLATTTLLAGPLRRKLGHTVLGRGEDVASLHLDNFYCAFSSAQEQLLLNGNYGAAYGNFLRYWEAAAARPLLSRLLYADQKTYLVELLMKQDRMSMACSIESRVPFLDHNFVEFSANVPARLKIRGKEQKYIFKRAVEDLLPRSIIYRRKMGFPTPLEQWLATPSCAGRVFEILRDREGILASLTYRAELDRLLDLHQRGLEDATDRIWRLLNFQIWGDIFITGRGAQRWDGIFAQSAAQV
jgi:asparagine synthase (glutamine-hydrolysing)